MDFTIHATPHAVALKGSHMANNYASTDLAPTGEPVITPRPLFSDHQTFVSLLPHLKAYALKGLHEYKTGQNGGKFSATALEQYSAQVLERVDALDSCISSLRLALSFIEDLDRTHSSVVELYRYHHENFLLRLTGIVDRAYRLVGASLMMGAKDLEKVGSNKLVERAVFTEYPDVHRVLKKLADVVAAHRNDRNMVAHSAAYSTRELGLFTAINTMNLGIEGIDIDELMDHYFSNGAVSMVALTGEIVLVIEELLDTLVPIYAAVAGGTPHGSV